jgi:hypothetical protein
MNLIRVFVTVPLLATILFGCGPGGPPPRPEGVAVSGKILAAGGSPLSGGTLILMPESGSYGATALIQSDGTFTLRDTADNQDIIPGKYQVFVIFPSSAHSALKRSVNKRYQETEDGDSDVFVNIKESTEDLVIRLKR